MIYFIRHRNTMDIKIGYAIDPAARLKTLQIGCPERLALMGFMPGTQDDERNMHEEYREFRRRGEWFHGAPGLLKDIESMLEWGGTPTVEEHCRCREWCRDRLRGVLVKIIGRDRLYCVHRSTWGSDHHLSLCIYPKGSEAPSRKQMKPIPDEYRIAPGSNVISLKLLVDGTFKTIYSRGSFPRIDADRCVLASPWPPPSGWIKESVQDWDDADSYDPEDDPPREYTHIYDRMCSYPYW